MGTRDDDVPARDRSAVQWMVFDLGHVVLRPTSALPDLAALMGLDPVAGLDAFAAAYRAPRVEYDRTSDTRGYWASVARGCGAAAPGDDLVATLTERDVAGWLDADPQVLALIEDLHRIGVRLAVLSNAPSAMGDSVRRQGWARPFEHILVSGDLGVVKPEPAIFRILLDTLGCPPPRVAFTDDLPDNVAAARRAGIHAVRFTGAGPLRRSLAALGWDV